MFYYFLAYTSIEHRKMTPIAPIWKNTKFVERMLTNKFGIQPTPANIALFQHLADTLNKLPTYEDWVQNLV